jgi:antitoxin component of MazEF toxin-antitoxin module
MFIIMPLMFSGNAMKVGNSMVVVLPKTIVDNFGIEKGDSIKMVVTDKGIYIPLSPKGDSNNKEIEKIMKEMKK